jgi:hypothetical protein
MLIQGVVVSYSPNTKATKQGGGTYDAWELVYRNEKNEIKSVVKPATGLKFKPNLKTGLAALSPGDQFTMVMEKENDYWTPQSVEKGLKDVQDMGAGSAAKPDGNRALAPAREGKVTGSNYETPEERTIRREIDAKRQVIITRQATLNTALEALKAIHGGPGQFTTDAVIALAKDFEKHVYKDMPKVAKKFLEASLAAEEVKE